MLPSLSTRRSPGDVTSIPYLDAAIPEVTCLNPNLAVVLSALLNWLVEIAAAEWGTNPTLLRTLRVVRITRVLRTLRIIKSARCEMLTCFESRYFEIPMQVVRT